MEILRAKLAGTEGKVDESLAQSVDKGSAAHGMGLAAIARHNARLGSGSEVQKAVDAWDLDKNRAFGHIGLALGLQDSNR